MKISIFLITFFISTPFITSYNLTLFLEPENNLLADTVIKIMEESFIPYALGFSVSTTPVINSKCLKKVDIMSKLLKNLKEQVKYRFVDQQIPSLDKLRFFNVVVLMDFIDLRFVLVLTLTS